ncbi:hypothetical protein AAFF_G00266020 [Aldrovandia affinis]|uniref:Uncharacterized protein n=1 Tax=Aldrovandia affinis TaxID=143900 RepID=A0AAD7RBQ3_9TELE|nr:hypothetical protein AAFF_G00266020 [Aldrovandia affinis]
MRLAQPARAGSLSGQSRATQRRQHSEGWAPDCGALQRSGSQGSGRTPPLPLRFESFVELKSLSGVFEESPRDHKASPPPLLPALPRREGFEKPLLINNRAPPSPHGY